MTDTNATALSANPLDAGTDALNAPKPSILCVDDEPNILSALKRLFRGAGLAVHTAVGGHAGLALLETTPVDVVISDMRMPEMDGTQFLEQVRQRWPDTVRLLLTGYSEINSIVGAINRGEIYRYISKPWDDNDVVLIVRQALERKTLELEKRRLELLTTSQNEELRRLNTHLEARVAERTQQLSAANERLKSSFVTSIKIFSTLLEMRGGALSGHSRRVADLCRRIAAKLGLPPQQQQDLFVAALLHEIGKVGFSDDLLRTAVGSMSPPQLEQYRHHVVQAEQLLMPLQELQSATDIISAQFERFDGSGFPHKKAGDAIPLGARILAVASDYDNMQIGALVQKQLSPSEAQTLIQHAAGKRYDPQVVAAFIGVLGGAHKEAQESTTVEEVQLASEALEAGMVITRDLITPSGLLMLSAGHKLEGRLIQKIRDFERVGGLELKVYVQRTVTTPNPGA